MNILLKYIAIGKPDAVMCATCQYWEGGTHFVKSRNYTLNPEFMEVDKEALKTYAVCVKKKRRTAGFTHCSEHKYHYVFEKYLK